MTVAGLGLCIKEVVPFFKQDFRGVGGSSMTMDFVYKPGIKKN
jgi:hypothetical protein